MERTQYPRVFVIAAVMLTVALGELALWVWLRPSEISVQLDRILTAGSSITATPYMKTEPMTGTKNSTTPYVLPAKAALTPEVTVITPTPEPPNIFAAATQSLRLTEQAQLEGTPTPLPPYVQVATRAPIIEIVTATPTAANSATATYYALMATAIAITTGTPQVLVATSTPTLPPTLPTEIPTEQIERAIPDSVETPTPTLAPVTEEPTPTQSPTAVPSSTPTPVPTATSTIEPTVTQTARPTSTPTLMPTVTPTESPMPTATAVLEFAPVPEGVQVYRIRFRQGATSETIVGYVEDEQPVRFVLDARAGQPVTVALENDGNYQARVDISTEDGVLLGTAYAGKRWRSALPLTQSYYLTVRVPVGGTAHDFSLWVEILP